MAAVIEAARPTDRWLLAHGAPARQLERLLRNVHRAGFTIIPVVADTACDYAFELEHREAPRGSLRLSLGTHHYAGPCAFTVTELRLERIDASRKLAERVILLLDDSAHWQRARLNPAERAQLAAGERAHEAPVVAHLSTDSRWQDLGSAWLRALSIDLRYCLNASAEPGAAEGVHQLRVTTRRLRELLRLFADVLPPEQTQELRLQLRRLAAALGVVRDLDIRLARLPARDDADFMPLATDRYVGALTRARRHAHASLLDLLQQPKIAGLPAELAQLIALGRALDAPATVDARINATLPAILNAVRYAAERALKTGRARHLHRLRIKIKRLRYILETIVPIAGEEAASMAAVSTELQGLLGEHQDAITAANGLAAWLEHAPAKAAERRAIKQLLDREAHTATSAQRAFEHAWPTFAERSRARIMC